MSPPDKKVSISKRERGTKEEKDIDDDGIENIEIPNQNILLQDERDESDESDESEESEDSDESENDVGHGDMEEDDGEDDEDDNGGDMIDENMFDDSDVDLHEILSQFFQTQEGETMPDLLSDLKTAVDNNSKCILKIAKEMKTMNAILASKKR